MNINISGIGLATPWGNELSQIREAFLHETNVLSDLAILNSRFPVQNIQALKVGLVNFDPKPHVNPRSFRKYDEYSRLGCAVAKLALTNFNQAETLPKMAITFACESQVALTAEYMDILVKEGPDSVSPGLFPAAAANSSGSNVAIEFGIKGPNLNVSAKLSSGFMTAYCANTMLKSERVSECLIGSVDKLSQIMLESYGLMGSFKLAEDGQSGYHPGEASAALILSSKFEEQSYGYLRSAKNLSSDAVNYRWPSDRETHAEVVRQAMTEAGGEINYFFSAANGEDKVDQLESYAYETVLLNNRPKIFSIKKLIGESPTSTLVQMALACMLPAGSKSLITSVSPGGTHGALVIESTGVLTS